MLFAFSVNIGSSTETLFGGCTHTHTQDNETKRTERRRMHAFWMANERVFELIYLRSCTRYRICACGHIWKFKQQKPNTMSRTIGRVSVYLNGSFFAWYKIQNSTNFLWIWRNDHRAQRREKHTATAAASTVFCRQPFSFHIKPIHSRIYRKFLFRSTTFSGCPYINACAYVHMHFIFFPFSVLLIGSLMNRLNSRDEERNFAWTILLWQQHDSTKNSNGSKFCAKQKKCRSKSGSPWVNMNAKSKSRVATTTTTRSAEYTNERRAQFNIILPLSLLSHNVLFQHLLNHQGVVAILMVNAESRAKCTLFSIQMKRNVSFAFGMCCIWAKRTPKRICHWYECMCCVGLAVRARPIENDKTVQHSN